MKDQDKIKTKKDVLEFIDAYIHYRGGMFTRIDALDIKQFLNGERKREFKKIKRKWETVIRVPKKVTFKIKGGKRITFTARR